MIILFAIPYGFGAGAIDAALNNYVAVHYSSKHMSWLHCFWGVGTIISPLVMSYSLTNATWNTGYRIISIIQLGIGIIMLLTIPIWKVNAPKAEIQAERSHSIGIIDAFKIKGVPSLLLGFFGYCAAESTAMAWSCTYLVEAKGIDEPTAAAFASSFFIGMTVGRFLGGFIMDKLGDKNMIRLGTVIIFIGIALMLIPIDNTTISLIGLITIGLGCAPIYPCIIHSTPNNFGAENSGAIIGIQMASAYTGSILIPPILGVIGKYFSFNIFPIYIAIFVILMIIMTEKTFKITQK
jgi:fucose permease